MDIYVARQPIFQRNQKVFGYELLYRQGLTNSYDGVDGTQASLAVIRNAFLFLGEKLLTHPRRAFINFTGDLLINGVAWMLPSQYTVVEIMENIDPDDRIVEACRKLKEAGYTLALDDYTVDDEMQNRLLDIADIVKVSLTRATEEEREAIVRKFGTSRKKLVAEGVETPGDFEAALAMGYSYFQGYFFSKPVIVPGRDIPGFKLNYMRTLQELNRKELDFHALEHIIKQDMSLCYTLLKYINSSYFGCKDKISSILNAMVLLGEAEVRKWASLVVFTFLGVDKPPELIVRSLIRGKMCELLAGDVGLEGHESELFLAGMFSLIDVLIGRPLDDILERINLTEEVKEALLRKKGRYGSLYDLVVSYESGDWEKSSGYISRHTLDPERVLGNYVTAVEWADEITKAASSQSN